MQNKSVNMRKSRSVARLPISTGTTKRLTEVLETVLDRDFTFSQESILKYNEDKSREDLLPVDTFRVC